MRVRSPPLATPGPATYQCELVEHYVPNESWLMPQDVASECCSGGRPVFVDLPSFDEQVRDRDVRICRAVTLIGQ